MARKKSYPRFKGRLELHREKTFMKLNSADIDQEKLESLVEMLMSFMDTCKKWWWIETGYGLEILEDTEDPLCFVWTVEDIRAIAMVYPWLKPKAIKYETRIVKRLNYLIKEGLCGNVTSDREHNTH